MKLVYLSQGQLFLWDKVAPPKAIESPYGREVVERSLQRQNKNKWKSEGEGALFSRGSLWGVASEDPQAIRVNVTAISRGAQANQLFYALDTSTVGGLFSYDLESNKENRHFHRENMRLRDLCQSNDHDLLACSQHLPNGTSSIGICRKSDVETITEGDSVDEGPSWVPGSRKQLVFQSAGVARNAHGTAVGLGPFSIQRLDLEDGSLTALKEDEKFDFLAPKMDKNGQLYFIRRPYDKLGAGVYPPHKMLVDVALFPFRLLRALFHYLNFFSLIYSKKPLTTASGPKVETPDEKTLLLRGKVIDAERLLKEGTLDDGIRSLVPASWQLVRQDSSGNENVVAKAVLAFDLDAEGNVLYSNGSAIYRVTDGGPAQVLLKANLIETLVILP